jgi:hypothetical protein
VSLGVLLGLLQDQVLVVVVDIYHDVFRVPSSGVTFTGEELILALQ